MLFHLTLFIGLVSFPCSITAPPHAEWVFPRSFKEISLAVRMSTRYQNLNRPLHILPVNGVCKCASTTWILMVWPYSWYHRHRANQVAKLTKRWNCRRQPQSPKFYAICPSWHSPSNFLRLGTGTRVMLVGSPMDCKSAEICGFVYCWVITWRLMAPTCERNEK